MTAPRLSVDDYRTLLSAALASAQDADTSQPSVTNLFTPDGHRLALDVDATVVRGGRGVGKTFWYRSLLKEDLRRVAATEYRIDRLNHMVVAAGFGASLEPNRYPGPAELRQLIDADTNAYDLWNAVLLVSLKQPDLIRISSWKARITWVCEHSGERDHWIAQADRQAQAEGSTQLILFDALEHLHSKRQLADRWVAGILQLALEMRLRTNNIRFKVFIRHDMYDSALQNFPDASKLTSNAASLKWSTTNLYGLFFHQLGNASCSKSAAFRDLYAGWTEPTQGRYLLPAALLADTEAQTEAFKAVAGPHMGANFRKGITYTWLPNHLMDGAEQVSPRSFLSALATANQETITQFATHDYAIHHEGIRRGVQAASQTRVAEIREDMPWVHTAIEPLRGQQVPIEEKAVIDLWESGNLTELLRQYAEQLSSAGNELAVRTGPRFPDRYPRLINELIDLGVMRRRRDDRIDLPDVYRIAFSIGRKGGVPRVKV